MKTSRPGYTSVSLPREIGKRAAEYWKELVKSARDRDVDLGLSYSHEVERVFGLSSFIPQTCIYAPEMLQSLNSSGDLKQQYEFGHLNRQLRSKVEVVTNLDELYRILRQFRQREMVRIAWRDLAGLATLLVTMEDLSALADACLEETLKKLYIWQAEKQGIPVDSQGSQQQLIVIAMGKLGARELNFSSDIDLIFAYPETGYTSKSENPVTTETFFNHLGRQLIKALASNTEDGFVFRVDMRLRPYGENGPLVMDFDAMEEYYQSMGRDWERYAWVKARVAATNTGAGANLFKNLKPFVYRRYIDFGNFESLREMKHLIEEDVNRKGMEGNIKLGAGGIREIEFIGQTFQLLRGGKEPLLQERSILRILSLLAELGYMPKRDSKDLQEAYIFLRQTEHRLQEYEDKQLHSLPVNEFERTILAAGMGFESWPKFTAVLNQHTKKVRTHFAKLFTATDNKQSKKNTAQEGATALWQNQLNPDKAIQFLAGLGMQNPKETSQLVINFCRSNQVSSLSPVGRTRLDRLMPKALLKCAQQGGEIETVKRFIGLIEQIIRRSSYIALLNENPRALDHLLRLITASSMIAELLTRHPLLLDELLDSRTLYAPADMAILTGELEQRLNRLPAEDLEQILDELRGFKLVHVLRVAAADVTDVLPIMKVSDYLTFIAETVVTKTLNIAWQQVADKFGVPAMNSKDAEGIAVIAYGKFGGLELGYGSDLDLVFLRSDKEPVMQGMDPVDTDFFYSRLGQRFVHIMTAHTPEGVLYHIDMRLRPDGESGILMTTVESFAEYQASKAWVWEHQALVRARPIAGDDALFRQFNEIRHAVLTAKRDSDLLRQEIIQMRNRMLAERKPKKTGMFDLKNDPGGIIDIEFMVQYLILRDAHRYPELICWTDNIRQMETIGNCGLLKKKEVELLKKAYLAYRQTVHRQTLQNLGSEVDSQQFQDLRDSVIKVWEKILADPIHSEPAS